MWRLVLITLLVTVQCAEARRRPRTPQEKACWAEAKTAVPERWTCWPSGKGESCFDEAFKVRETLVQECLKRPL